MENPGRVVDDLVITRRQVRAATLATAASLIGTGRPHSFSISDDGRLSPWQINFALSRPPIAPLAPANKTFIRIFRLCVHSFLTTITYGQCYSKDGSGNFDARSKSFGSRFRTGLGDKYEVTDEISALRTPRRSARPSNCRFTCRAKWARRPTDTDPPTSS
jgi:hypothetical protein